MTSLGQRLRELRELAGLTVRDLADRVNKSPGYISKIEVRNEIPNAELLCVLADIYQVAPEELLELSKKSYLDKTEHEIEEKHKIALTLYRKSNK